MQHGLPLRILEIYIGTQAYQRLDVVLFDAHDRIVEGRGSVVVRGVGVESGPDVFEEVECDHALSLLCGAMDHGEAHGCEHAKVCLVLRM